MNDNRKCHFCKQTIEYEEYKITITSDATLTMAEPVCLDCVTKIFDFTAKLKDNTDDRQRNNKNLNEGC